VNNSQLFLKVQIRTNCLENVTKKERFLLYIKQVPMASYFGYNTRHLSLGDRASCVIESELSTEEHPGSQW
jgi:hypothetical protein